MSELSIEEREKAWGRHVKTNAFQHPHNDNARFHFNAGWKAAQRDEVDGLKAEIERYKTQLEAERTKKAELAKFIQAVFDKSGDASPDNWMQALRMVYNDLSADKL